MEKILFNPLGIDFSYVWLDDNNEKHTLTVPAKGIAHFTVPQFNFMQKHLVDEIMSVRKINPILEDKRREIYNEVETKV